MEMQEVSSPAVSESHPAHSHHSEWTELIPFSLGVIIFVVLALRQVAKERRTR